MLVSGVVLSLACHSIAVTEVFTNGERKMKVDDEALAYALVVT